MKNLVRFVAVLFLFSSALYSQSPTELTKKYFEVFKAGEYVKVAEMISPQELKEFRGKGEF